MSIKEVKIFISHSEDTEDLCTITKGIIKEESQNHYEREGYRLIPLCWDDINRGIGDPQEDLIDPIIKDENCILIIMIFWTIFGNPTPKFKSGLEHEYVLARDIKKNMLMFFGNIEIPPFNINPEQLKEVHNFKKRVEQERCYGHCGCFDSIDNYRQQIRSQLVGAIDKFKKFDQNLKENFDKFSRGF